MPATDLRPLFRTGLLWLLDQWRFLLLGAVLLVAAASFTFITTTGQTDRASTPPEALYRAIALFLVESDGFPHSGPAFWMAAAWATYFLAPLITLSAFIEVVTKLGKAFSSPDRVARRMRDHFVICGYGKHGRMALETLLQRHPDASAVILDNSPTLDDYVVLGDGRRLPVVRADLQYDPISALQRVQLQRARELIVATGDDVLNLAVCVAAQGETTRRDFQAVVLVADVHLAAGFRTLVPADAVRVKLVNTYDIAAKSLLDRIDGEQPRFDPAERDLLVLGFGRFGTMLTRAALARWRDVPREPWVTVVDLEADAKLRHYQRLESCPDGGIRAISGNIEDPAVIDRAVAESRGSSGRSPLIVLCTDSDTTNLRTAMMLRKFAGAEPVMLTRMFEPPPHHLKQLLTEHQITCFELRELIAQRLEI